MEIEGHHPTVTVTEARQGNRRMTNTRVLVVSLAVVAVLFALIYVFFFNNPPPAGTPAV